MALKLNEDVVWSVSNITTMNTTMKPDFPIFQTLHLTLHALNMIKSLSIIYQATFGLAGVILNIISAIVGLAVILTYKSTWEQVQPHVENLIQVKLEKFYLELAENKFQGVVRNMEKFKDVLQIYEDALPENKTEAAGTLRTHYIGLLFFMDTVVSELQAEQFAAQALPVFAVVANMELLLLVEGIFHGESWGFSKDYVERLLRGMFNKKTGIKEGEPPGVWRGGVVPRNMTARALSDDAQTKWQMELLGDAIKKGEAAGLSPKLLATWKHAYTAHTVRRRSSAAASQDYPAYARDTYERGRPQIKPPPKGKKRQPWFVQQTAYMRSLAEYDALMSSTVLMHTEHWPYLTGEFEVPQHVMERMDREIYSGPYGAWKLPCRIVPDHPLPWGKYQAPPIRPRSGNMTAVSLRSDRFITAAQVKSGYHWDTYYGGELATGRSYRIDLDPDEYIYNVTVASSTALDDGYRIENHVIRALRFTSNKRVYGPYGSGHCSRWKEELSRNASVWGITVSRPGYRLSSIHLNAEIPVRRLYPCQTWGNWYLPPSKKNKTKKCREVAHGHTGIFFGWRPMLFATSDFVPTNFTDIKAPKKNKKTYRG